MTKEMIFDLQLFDGEVNATVNGTSANEVIKVDHATGGNTFKYESNNADLPKNPSTATDADVKIVNAGAGADTIKVDTGVAGLTITGGSGNDVIEIKAENTGGNTYLYNYGEGKDTIYGFNTDGASDTIMVGTNKAYDAVMGVDGRSMVVSVGSSSNVVYVNGLTAGQKVKIYGQYKDGTIGEKEFEVTKLMQGTTSADSINNVYIAAIGTEGQAGYVAAVTPLEGEEGDIYVVDAGNGADTINNSGNYVSISGGLGADKIFITKNNTTPTSNNTIYGGLGNDTIDAKDDKNGDTLGAHVYQYFIGDGKDVIEGYNSSDTIKIFLTDDSASDTILKSIATSNVDTTGGSDNKVNYVINLGTSGSITLKEVEADTTLAIEVYKADKATKIETMPTGVTLPTSVPKMKRFGSAANEITANLDGFTIDAGGGNDIFTVTAMAQSLSGGSGADLFVLKDGTNFDKTESKTVVANAVTIIGGAGNDSINALSDTVVYTPEGGTETTAKATHVYQFGPSDGNDTIWGFNDSDTVQITNATATVTTDFDTTGNYFIKVNSAVLTLVLDDDFKKGSNLNLYQLDKDGTTYTKSTTITKVPQVLKGTTGADGLDKLTNNADDYAIDALSGNDAIKNIGASNVSISGGAGNDTVYLAVATDTHVFNFSDAEGGVKANPVTGGETTADTTYTVVAGDATYGANVTIDGGAGNDLIIAEHGVNIASGTNTTYTVVTDTSTATVDKSALPHYYTFGTGDGNDTIQYFKTSDVIALKEGAYETAHSIRGDDFIIYVGRTQGPSTSYTSTITLKDFAKDNKGSAVLLYEDGKNVEKQIEVPRAITGTAGNDKGANSLELVGEASNQYIVNALAGDDSIYVGGADENSPGPNDVTVDAGVGNDTIYVHNSNNDSIVAGAGNDKVILKGTSSASFIEVGAGNDTIFSDGGQENVFAFGNGEGTNYIFGFKEGDGIYVKDSTLNVTTSTTINGFLVQIGTTQVYLKGQISDTDVSSDTFANYLNAEGGTSFNLYNTKDSEGNLVEIKEVTIPKEIAGGTTPDTITNELIEGKHFPDDYTISAGAGNDSIVNYGSNVLIDAGLGDDRIHVMEEPTGNTVIGGGGNDLIFGNGNGNVYKYTPGDGNDTIFGWGLEDTLQIVGATYSYASVTNEGFEVKVGSNRILIMGKMKSNVADANKEKYASFDKLNVDDVPYVNILSTKDGVETLSQPEVKRLLLGSAIGETLTNTVDGYEILAYGGNDLIENKGADVTIDAGAGNDTISLEGDVYGVVVKPGLGNDSIKVDDADHVFEFSLGDGVNTIDGIGQGDIIHLLGDANIKEGKLTDVTVGGGTKKAYVMTLTDNVTKIYLLPRTNESFGGGKNGAFLLQVGDGEADAWNIPNEIQISAGTQTSIVAVNAITSEYLTNNDLSIVMLTSDYTGTETVRASAGDALVIGNLANDTIINKDVNNLDIQTYAGNDFIEIGTGTNNTINAGVGNDTIKIGEAHGHVVKYAKNDGNDVIEGWDDADTLELSNTGLKSAKDIATVYSGSSFVLSIGSYKLTFKGVKAGQTINITGDFEDSIEIPKIIQGTTADDKGEDGSLLNKNDEFGTDISAYLIEANSGNDSIVNEGHHSSIYAGSGNDTVYNSEDATDVIIDGDTGHDRITNTAARVSIYAGAGNDIVSLSGYNEATTVNAGQGDDIIYGNSGGNVYQYLTSDDGNDSIFGFTGEDVIELGGGVSVEDTVATNAGYGLKLSNGKTLILKGEKIFDETTGDYVTSDTADAFEALRGGTQIHVKTLNTESGEWTETVYTAPSKKLATAGVALENADTDYELAGTSSADTIKNSGDNATIDGSKGADLILNNGGSAYIIGGDGADVVVLGTKYNYKGTDYDYDADTSSYVTGTANNTTIYAGDGNDTIYGNAGKTVYLYAEGDDKDVIYGFDTTQDVIAIQGDGISYDEIEISEVLNTYKINEAYKTKVQFDALTSDEEKVEYNKLVITSGVEDAQSDTTWNSWTETHTTDSNTYQTSTTFAATTTEDNPEVKDVVLKMGSGFITLKNLTIDSFITLGDGTKIQVPKYHVISDAESDSYTSSVAGYTLDGKGNKGGNNVINEADMITMNLGNGNNTVNNEAGGLNATIVTGSGDDLISNTAYAALIQVGDGNNTIENKEGGSSASIISGAGQDYVANSESAVFISTGAESDTILNAADVSAVIIDAGEGDDTITDSGAGTSINAGAGDDVIKLSHEATQAIVIGGEGNDTVHVNYDNDANTVGGNTYYFSSGTGDDIVDGILSGDRVQLALTEDETYNVTRNPDSYVFTIYDKSGSPTTSKGTLTLTNLVDDGEGNYTKTQLDGDLVINVIDGKGNDLEEITTPREVTGTASSDSLTVAAGKDSYVVNAESGNDTIVNAGFNTTIYAGEGNDMIFNSDTAGQSAYIFGEAGSDTIVLGIESDGAITYVDIPNVTINGGAGNDSIVASETHTNSIVYEYAEGDGNDTILNYNDKDIIQISSDFEYTVDGSGDDESFVLNIGTGSIKLQGYHADSANPGTVKVKVLDTRSEENEVQDIIVPNVVNVPTAHIDGATVDGTVTQEEVFARQLENNTSYAIINGTSSGDTITNVADHVLIYGKGGADKIILDDKEGVTVVAGEGNDVIVNSDTAHANGVLYKFTTNNGYNYIEGFNNNDTIQITGEGEISSIIAPGATSTDYPDVIFTIGTNTTINLKGYGKVSDEHDRISIMDSTMQVTEIVVPKVVPGTSGTDSLVAPEDQYELQGGAGRDTLINSEGYNRITMRGGNDDDRLENNGLRAVLYGDAGNDTIINSGQYAKIYGGDGVDVITNSGEDVYIDAGDGNDRISLGAGSSNATVYFGAGNDTVWNNDEDANGHVYQVSAFTGNNYIFNFNNEEDAIQLMDGSTLESVTKDSFVNGRLTLILTSGTSRASLSIVGMEAGKSVNVIDSEGNETDPITIPLNLDLTTGNDSVTVEAGQSSYNVNAFAGNDTITNKGLNTTIYGDAGNDVVNNSGAKASIHGGAGNDSIYNNADDVTIYAGAGNDTIYNKNTGSKGVIYQFGTSEGNTTIQGFDFSKDKLVFLNGTSLPGSGDVSLSADRTQYSIKLNNTTVVLDAGVNSSGVRQTYNFTEQIPISIGAAAENATSSETVTSNLLAGTAGNNAFADNTFEKITIATYAGNDTLVNTAKVVFIDASGGGANRIFNYSSDVTIVAGAGADSIVNGRTVAEIMSLNNITDADTDSKTKITSAMAVYGNEISINSGAGNDSIRNYADNVTIYAGTGNDRIYNENVAKTVKESSREGVVYYFGTNEGNDTIEGFDFGKDKLYFANATVLPSESQVSLSHDKTKIMFNFNNTNVYLYAGTREDTRNVTDSTGATVQATDAEGKPLYNLDGGGMTTDTTNVNTTTAVTATETYTAQNYYDFGDAYEVNIVVGSVPDVSVTNEETGEVTTSTAALTDTSKSISFTTFAGTNSNDNFTKNTTSNITIATGNGNDTLANDAECVYIYAGTSGNDSITNLSANVTINATNGNDTIVNGTASADKVVSIHAGVGNDQIINYFENVTIYAGAGNDTIYNYANVDNKGNVYQFGTSEGNTTIQGFDFDNDKIQFLNSSSLPASTNVSISADKSHILLRVDQTNVVLYAGTHTVEAAVQATNSSGRLLYLDANNQTTTTVTGTIASVQAANTDGELLYWQDTESTTMTTTANDSPVWETTTGIAKNTYDFNSETVQVVIGANAFEAESTTTVKPTFFAGSNNADNFGTNTISETVFGFGGNDTIVNQKSGAYIDLGVGNDIATNTADSVTLISGAGNDTILNRSASTSIHGGGGGNNLFIIEKASGETSISSTTAVTLVAGAGNDTVNISRDYTYYADYGGVNKTYLNANNATVSLGGGTDSVYVAQDNNTILTGAGNDTIRIHATASDTTNTIDAGAGNDRIYIEDGQSGTNRIVIPTIASGNDTIYGFDSAKTIFYLESSSTSVSSSIVGSGATARARITFTTGTASTTVELDGKGAGTSVRYTSGAGTSTSSFTIQENSSARVLDDPEPFLDLFEDDNFITNEPQLSSITELSTDNYSAGNIEALDIEKLVQSGYNPLATYGTEKKQE